MKPELNIGDIVIVKETEEDQLKEGDIISYREGQNVVTHRIIQILIVDGETQFKTKGDNNNTDDNKTIKTSLIEGKVLGKIPFIGKITLLLQGKMTIVIIVIAFYAYSVQSEKIKKIKERRRLKRIEYEQKAK